MDLADAYYDLSNPSATVDAGRWPREGAHPSAPPPLEAAMSETLRGYQVDVIADVEREIAAGNGASCWWRRPVRQDHRRRRDHPALREPLSPGSGAGASAGDHYADQRQAPCPQHCARHHQGRIRTATDGAGAARFRADPVGARHALGGDAAAARRSGDHRRVHTTRPPRPGARSSRPTPTRC